MMARKKTKDELLRIIGRLVALHQVKDDPDPLMQSFYQDKKPFAWRLAYQAVGKEMKNVSSQEADQG